MCPGFSFVIQPTQMIILQYSSHEVTLQKRMYYRLPSKENIDETAQAAKDRFKWFFFFGKSHFAQAPKCTLFNNS